MARRQFLAVFVETRLHRLAAGIHVAAVGGRVAGAVPLGFLPALPCGEARRGGQESYTGREGDGSVDDASQQVNAYLLDDLDDAPRTRVDEHGMVVDDGVVEVRQGELGGYVVVDDTVLG